MMHGNLPNREGKTEVRGLIVDPRNADSIAVACGSQWATEPLGVFITSDGGKTLTQTLKTRFGGNADFRWDGFVLGATRPTRMCCSPDRWPMASSAQPTTARRGRLPRPGADGFFITDIRLDHTGGKLGWASPWRGRDGWAARTPR